MNEVVARARRLIAYIELLPDFELIVEMPARYDHMGAIIAEAALQAGINYEHVVRPRIEALLASHGEQKTTGEFQRLLMALGATTLLSWRWDRKINTIIDLTRMFMAEGVDTVEDLYQWMLQEGSRERLKQVHGVGDKTADLLKIVVGIPASAIDRHIYNFLAQAGVPAASYQEAQETLNTAADLMGVSHSALDQSIWQYMSG